MAEGTLYRLVRVYDMREYDYDLEQYIPLEKGQGNICERCTREHAKVYVIETLNDHKDHFVGSTCSRKWGWEPQENEVRAANKIMRAEQKQRAKEKYIEQRVQPLADFIFMLDVPPIKLVEEDTRQVRTRAMVARYRWVCGDFTNWFYHNTLDQTEKLMMVHMWHENRIKEVVKAVYGTFYDESVYKVYNHLRDLVQMD